MSGHLSCTVTNATMCGSIGSPLLGLEEGGFRGPREKIGDTAEYLQRFNGTRSRKIGEKTSSVQVFEDKGFNMQQIWQAFHTEPVLAADFSLRDSTYSKITIDGLASDTKT